MLRNTNSAFASSRSWFEGLEDCVISAPVIIFPSLTQDWQHGCIVPNKNEFCQALGSEKNHLLPSIHSVLLNKGWPADNLTKFRVAKCQKPTDCQHTNTTHAPSRLTMHDFFHCNFVANDFPPKNSKLFKKITVVHCEHRSASLSYCCDWFIGRLALPQGDTKCH